MQSSTFCFLLLTIWLFSFSAYSQCLEEGQVFLPEPVISNGDQYGNPIIGFEDYILVSAPTNDQYEFNGGISYLYRLNSGTWTKQAEFRPSEHLLQMFFGRKIAMDTNIVVVAGNTFTPEGYHFDELFVYTKSDGEEWMSRTESYKINLRNDLEKTGLIINEIVINRNILGVSYYTSTEDNIAFYQINKDLTIDYITTLKGVSNGTFSNDYFGHDFDFTHEFIAVRGLYIDQSLHQRKGVVFVYDLNKVLNNSDHQPIALLKPQSEDQVDFGIQIEVDEDHIYATNSYEYSDPTEYPTQVFIFKKPDLGWADNTESAILDIGRTDYYGTRHTLKIYNDYVFLSRAHGDNRLYIFKKNSGWTSKLPDAVFKKEKESESDRHFFALDFAVLDNHIVANYLGSNSHSGINDYDKVLSYHAPDGAYENISGIHQELSELYFSATEFLFGGETSFSNNRIAVGSLGDKVNGRNSGAVYVYEKNNQSEEFDLSEVIRPPDAKSYDAFGHAVELADTLLFISSLYADSLNADGSYYNSAVGKVYQYALENGQWKFKASFYSPVDLSIKEMKHFGRSISYSNGYVAVSQYYTGSSEENGTVHIFKMLEDYQWEHVATMKTKDQQGGDFFGSNIILQDSLLMVGTGNPAYGETDEMRVYLFKKNGGEWESKSEDAYLVPSVKGRADRFGFSINMNRDLIVVGAPGYNYGDTKKFAGRAYVFKRPEAGWEGRIEETLTLEPKDPKEEDFFGFDVFIDENNILIGAASSINNPNSAWYSSDIKDLQPGKIYFFDPYSENDRVVKKRNERYIQLSDNNRYLDGFGYHIEGANDRIFVSAIYDNNASGFRAGAVFELKYTTFIYRVENTVSCNREPFYLKSNRLGGYWSGEGIADSLTGLFDPSLIPQNGWTLVTYTAGDCRVTSSIYIGSLPVITSRSDSEINKCEGDKVNLFVKYTSTTQTTTEWYYKSKDADHYDVIMSNTTNLEVIKPGLYKVEIYAGLCKPVVAEFVVNDYLNDVKLNFNDFVEVCSYEIKSLTLTSSSETRNVSWFLKEPNAAQFSTVGTGNNLPLNKSGFYFATFETDYCVFNSDTVEVYYNHKDIVLVDPGVICESSEFQLHAVPEDGMWSGDEISDEGIISVHNLDNGVYYATYKVQQDKCTFKDSIEFEVLILEKPQVEHTSDEVCPDEPVDLSVINNPYDAEINWLNTSGNNFITASEKFSTDKPGEYFAQLTLKGCERKSDSVTLSVRRDSLFVPNVVTQNYDGANDEFKIFNYGTNDLKLTILDRWGEVIYYTDENEQIIWNPEKHPAGVYYWHIQYFNCFEERKSFKGWVHVIK